MNKNLSDLRDLFAGQAMAALVEVTYDVSPHNLAKKAYVIADAMISARTKPRPKTKGKPHEKVIPKKPDASETPAT